MVFRYPLTCAFPLPFLFPPYKFDRHSTTEICVGPHNHVPASWLWHSPLSSVGDFCFMLVAPIMASSSATSSASMAFDSDEKPHVLAVDDSLIDRRVIERLLIHSACKVTTAENGKRALEFLGLADGQNSRSSDLKVNLIITDYCMPGMTGYELLKKIKESPNMMEIPVVIVSSENIPSRIKQCLEDGAQEFLLKPLRLSDVTKLRCHIKKPNDPCQGMLCEGK